MYYSDFIEEGTYLAHHGIKGQRWGVRRYQNPDGSLTELGKKKYLINDGNTLSRKAFRYRDLKGNKIDTNAYHRYKIKDTADKVQRRLTSNEKKELKTLKQEYMKYHNEWLKVGKEISKKLSKDKSISGIDEHDDRFFSEMRSALGDKKYTQHQKAEYAYYNARFNIAKDFIRRINTSNTIIPIIEGYSNSVYGIDLARELIDRLDKQTD